MIKTNLPIEDIAPNLRNEIDKHEQESYTIKTVQIRMKGIENAIGFKDIKESLDRFLKINNFSQMEIKSIYHLMNSFYFMGAKL
jgi:hypothetical protein